MVLDLAIITLSKWDEVVRVDVGLCGSTDDHGRRILF